MFRAPSGTVMRQGNYGHDSEPSGHRTVEVAGGEAIVATILEPMFHRSYGMCGTFCFCIVAPLG
jgi:hypothetical protein